MGPEPKLPPRPGVLHARFASGSTAGILPSAGIGHEPGAAALGDFVDVAELGGVADLAFRVAAKERRTLERLLLTLLHQVGELLRTHVFHSPAGKLRGRSKGVPYSVLVRVVALQVRVAPRVFVVERRHSSSAPSTTSWPGQASEQGSKRRSAESRVQLSSSTCTIRQSCRAGVDGSMTTVTQSVGTKFERLVEIMRRLRAPDGCPWDREQTPGFAATVRPRRNLRSPRSHRERVTGPSLRGARRFSIRGGVPRADE